MAPSAADDFKWFGEGFDGFPRLSADNNVEYSVYFISHSERGALNAKLEEARKFAADLTHRLLASYIWQDEGFSLDLVRRNGQNILQGRTSCGDSIEDEWLIVYMLRELSKHFLEAWIQLTDTDGEFLLIEAAHALPEWLTPENSKNRVWMHGGQIYIIPAQEPHVVPGRKFKYCKGLTTEEALFCLRYQKVQHYPSLEIDAFRRLQDYPARIEMNLHSAVVRVPRKLALVLREYPGSVSQAIEAFYLRDPIAMRPLRTTDDRTLNFPASDLVLVSVKFNRVGYAQLRGQHFDSPHTWTQAKRKDKLAVERRSETGMKLTCGYEMLLSDPKNQSQLAVRNIKVLLEDLVQAPQRLLENVELADESTAGDDERWMEIGYEDFEKEVNGNGQGSPPTGFGDLHAQENLRQMAARLGTILSDNGTGDTEDESDGSTSTTSDSASSKGTEEESSLEEMAANEAELTAMMQRMTELQRGETTSARQTEPRKRGFGSGENRTDVDKIRELATAMEAELREAGALKQDTTSSEP